MVNEYLDADGYPTEDALACIENWSSTDPRGWFRFIANIWYLRSWGWAEDRTENDKYEYTISTAGWSGNEDIIRAMQENSILWSTTWVQTRRGGHYIFEVKDE